MTHQNEGKKPYECDICGKVFHTKEHLDEHVKIHDVIKDANEDSKDQTNEIKQPDEKNHSCPHCDLKFSLIYTLENHIDNEHKVDENLNVEEDLKTHIETVHIEEKPSDCKPKKTIESPVIVENEAIPQVLDNLSTNCEHDNNNSINEFDCSSGPKSPKIDEINEILVEKLLKTSDYKSRKENILKYGDSDFAIWFQEESCCND